jgi:hypothetical protein
LGMALWCCLIVCRLGMYWKLLASLGSHRPVDSNGRSPHRELPSNGRLILSTGRPLQKSPVELGVRTGIMASGRIGRSSHRELMSTGRPFLPTGSPPHKISRRPDGYFGVRTDCSWQLLRLQK